jgi:hypothetical protein
VTAAGIVPRHVVSARDSIRRHCEAEYISNNCYDLQLHNLYPSPDVIRQIKLRRMRWAGKVARMREERKVYKVLVGKPEGKRPLGRPRHGWEGGIRID